MYDSLYDNFLKEILISIINKRHNREIFDYLDNEHIFYIIKNGGLHPFVAYHVNKINNFKSDIKNSAFIEEGIQKFYGNVKNNFVLNQVLHSLKNVFDKAGIDFYLLKGKVLSEKYYCHIGCRPIGDIDLFIFPENRNRVMALLKNMGWQLYFSDKEKKIDHFTFFKGNITIEFHWEISIFSGVGNNDIFRITYDILKKHIEEVEIEGLKYYTFTPEIHFIHSIFNWLKKYGWPPVKILDMYFIYKRVDRVRLFRIAKKIKVFRMVNFFINMMKFYFEPDFVALDYICDDFKLIKKFANYRKNFFLKVLYYFSDSKLDLLYFFYRKVFPRHNFLQNYFYKGSYVQLLYNWYKEKIIEGTYHK